MIGRPTSVVLFSFWVEVGGFVEGGDCGGLFVCLLLFCSFPYEFFFNTF